MGAGVYWKVRVLKVVEVEVDAYGVTADEAEQEAKKMPDVIRVLDVTHSLEEQE